MMTLRRSTLLRDAGRQPVKGWKYYEIESQEITPYDVIFPWLRRLLESFRHTLEVVKILSESGRVGGDALLPLSVEQTSFEINSRISGDDPNQTSLFRTNLNDPLGTSSISIFLFFLLRSIDRRNHFCKNNNFFFLRGKPFSHKTCIFFESFKYALSFSQEMNSWNIVSPSLPNLSIIKLSITSF